MSDQYYDDLAHVVKDARESLDRLRTERAELLLDKYADVLTIGSSEKEKLAVRQLLSALIIEYLAIG